MNFFILLKYELKKINFLRKFILLVKEIYFRPKLISKKNIINHKRVLITGANSGIGLALTKLLLNNNNFVIALYNKKFNNLSKINNKNLVKIKYDLSSFEDFRSVEKKINSLSPQIIVNNAAYFDKKYSFGNYKSKDFFNNLYKGFNVNSFSILKIVFAIFKKIKKNKIDIILNISSDAGIISKNYSKGGIVYKTSKTTLNAITKCLYLELKEYGINVFALHPGPVKTKSNPHGLISPEICALKIEELLSKNDKRYAGMCIDINEKILQN
jgi:short-subunit dehydrogenase